MMMKHWPEMTRSEMRIDSSRAERWGGLLAGITRRRREMISITQSPCDMHDEMRLQVKCTPVDSACNDRSALWKEDCRAAASFPQRERRPKLLTDSGDLPSFSIQSNEKTFFSESDPGLLSITIYRLVFRVQRSILWLFCVALFLTFRVMMDRRCPWKTGGATDQQVEEEEEEEKRKDSLYLSLACHSSARGALSLEPFFLCSPPLSERPSI